MNGSKGLLKNRKYAIETITKYGVSIDDKRRSRSQNKIILHLQLNYSRLNFRWLGIKVNILVLFVCWDGHEKHAHITKYRAIFINIFTGFLRHCLRCWTTYQKNLSVRRILYNGKFLSTNLLGMFLGWCHQNISVHRFSLHTKSNIRNRWNVYLSCTKSCYYLHRQYEVQRWAALLLAV